jgi:tagatose-1,6-bisphosphate aldolase non-catalytic subunit AgaZ/GatZ
MLKRPVVSLFHSLKSKGMRYYWVPPNPEDLNKLSLIKQKYEIPKDILELMETQESNIKDLNTQLTNQKKVIEKIYDKLHDMQNYSYDTRFLHFQTFMFVIFTFIKC